LEVDQRLLGGELENVNLGERALESPNACVDSRPVIGKETEDTIFVLSEQDLATWDRREESADPDRHAKTVAITALSSPPISDCLPAIDLAYGAESILSTRARCIAYVAEPHHADLTIAFAGSSAEALASASARQTNPLRFSGTVARHRALRRSAAHSAPSRWRSSHLPRSRQPAGEFS
jgi:hypothetical protein